MCIDALSRQLQQLRLNYDDELPLQLLQCIVSYAPLASWSCLRLASRQFAAVVDQFNSTLRIADCDYLPSEARLSVIRQHIKRLRVQSTRVSWHKLQQLVQCNPDHGLHGLPQLQHLIIHTKVLVSIPSTCAAHLTNLTRLDIRCPGTATLPESVQLPHLRAASFACTVQLAQLAAFAPNIEQLWVSTLELPSALSTAVSWSAPSSSRSSIAALRAAPVLCKCTHLGCRTLAAGSTLAASAAAAAEVSVLQSYHTAPTASVALAGSSTSAVVHGAPQIADAQAVAAPFPSLRGLSCLPALQRPNIGSPALPYGDNTGVQPAELVAGLLGSCSTLQAVRMSGHWGHKAAAARLHALVGLEQLTQLSLHSGSRCISAFTSITVLSALQHLQHIRVTGSCRRPARVALLLDKLAQLQSLKSLALPAELLCDRCCSAAASHAVQHSMWNLVQQCNNLSRVVFLPGTATQAGRVVACAHPGKVSDNAALLGCVWKAAAVFAGLSAAAPSAAQWAVPAGEAHWESSTIAGLKQQWQQQQQVLLQQQHQQMQQRVEQLHVEVVGLPCWCVRGCKGAQQCSASDAACCGSDSCAVGTAAAAASSTWGVFGPGGEW